MYLRMALTSRVARMSVKHILFLLCGTVFLVTLAVMHGDQLIFKTFDMADTTLKHWYSKSSGDSAGMTDNSDNETFRVVAPGENLQPGELEVFIPTAVYYPHFPAQSGFNLFLNGWARHKSDMNFKCCLMRAAKDGSPDAETLTEVQTYNYHIYEQWIVDMQNAEFSCSISKSQITSLGNANFSYVTFAETSCLRAPRELLKIVYPERADGTVGVCLKISYGTINPEHIIEWFEYARMMNVTKVFTYTFEINESAMKVFEYYAGIGFLEMQPIHPAKSKFGPKRGYNRPRFEQQAWVDEVMGANDCKHRMSGYDYVIVMDMDEFICPQRTLTSYYDILKEASKMKPSAGAFVFDSHVMMLDWGETRVSPIRLMRYTQRTTVPNYDGPDKNTRWAFMPRRTYYARNNYVDVKGPFTTWQVPYELYTLFHYRNCKFTWKGCKEREREEDNSMLKFEQPLLERIRHLPLKMLLFNNTNYFNYLMSWNQ